MVLVSMKGMVIFSPFIYGNLEAFLREVQRGNVSLIVAPAIKTAFDGSWRHVLQWLKELGVKFVVIGHSERREYYGETDKTVNLKVKKALEVGLRPIICVGETLEQREYDVTAEHITMQVKIALADIPAEKMRKIVFAYEPIWAIGTGKTATAEQAEEVCELIRAVIRAKYGARVARSVTIQYGGSMNPKNAAELLSMPDVDGGLIGGASLKTEDFVAVINAANQ